MKSYAVVAFTFLFGLCPSRVRAGEIDPSLYNRESMKPVELAGLRVWLGKPVQITAQLGWQLYWHNTPYQPTWAFIHETPWLAKFPGGNLIATYTLDPDNMATPILISAFQISRDGGAHWSRRYSEIQQHNPMVFIPKPDDSLLAIAAEFVQDPAGDTRNFCGSAYYFHHGGKTMELMMDAVHLVDWPFPQPGLSGVRTGSPLPRDSWIAGPRIRGRAVQIGSRLIAGAHVEAANGKGCSEYAVSSDDGGFTWRYLSTIADPDPARYHEFGYEGPNEGILLPLADGEIMAVYRVGGSHHYINRAYSGDGGHTWTKPDELPAWAVKPAIVQATGGIIALSSGRPGVYLWLSHDPRARNWQSVDIVAYHNEWARAAWPGDPSYVIGTSTLTSPPHPANMQGRKFNQTTSYTGLAEVAPDKLILVYDRCTEVPPQNTSDLSRIFALPIEIERK